MNGTKKSHAGHWALFLVSLAGMILSLMFLPEVFWMSLPGLFTGIVLIMDWA